MRYNKDLLTHDMDYEDLTDCPAYLVFIIRPMKSRYRPDYHTVFKRVTIHSSQRKLMERGIVLDKFHARLIYKYPDMCVTRTGINRTPEVKIRNEYLIRRKTLRSKHTKATNKLKRWEDYQKTLLINELGSDEHLLVKAKIEEFKQELIKLEENESRNKSS